MLHLPYLPVAPKRFYRGMPFCPISYEVLHLAPRFTTRFHFFQGQASPCVQVFLFFDYPKKFNLRTATSLISWSIENMLDLSHSSVFEILSGQYIRETLCMQFLVGDDL